MRLAAVAIVLTSAFLLAQAPPPVAGTPHNIVLFVPDGLRALSVDASLAPALAAVRDRGVNFTNPHSLFPTFTTANASALATGHYLGDTGDFSNTIFTAFASPTAGGSVVPFLENDAVLGEVDAHFGGNYLNEMTLLEAARMAGYSTAVIGKLGPALIFDHRDRTGSPTIVVDDSTGTAAGIPLSEEVRTGLRGAGLPLATPPRGENGRAGTATTPGTLVPNTTQQDYLVEMTTKVVLPMLANRHRPFILVFWSRDPDGTQHGQGDSLNQMTPGVNGPTSLASIKNADSDLARIRASLEALGLGATTNVVVSADHGVSTVSKQSRTSAAAHLDYSDVPRGFLPPGFVALDLAHALGLPLFDPDNKNAQVMGGAHPVRGSGVIGQDALHPDVVVAANGGSDLIYLPGRSRFVAEWVVRALLEEDYVSGLFVDDALGKFDGALRLSDVNLKGSAVTPTPAIVINFRSESTGCPEPVLCAAEVADTTYQQGQGMHGNFSRADTMNFMAAIGPDFKPASRSAAPASNADVGRTIAQLLGLKIAPKGRLSGRVLTEALVGGKAVDYQTRMIRSDSASVSGGTEADKGNRLATWLRYQVVGGTRYFDAAGFPGRTVGLDGPKR